MVFQRDRAGHFTSARTEEQGSSQAMYTYHAMDIPSFNSHLLQDWRFLIDLSALVAFMYCL